MNPACFSSVTVTRLAGGELVQFGHLCPALEARHRDGPLISRPLHDRGRSLSRFSF